MTMEIGSVVHSTMNTPGETMGIINPLLCHYHLDTFTLVKVLNCGDRRKEGTCSAKTHCHAITIGSSNGCDSAQFQPFFSSNLKIPLKPT